MDILSLLVGILIGWLIEWAIDFFYWRGRNAEAVAALEETRAKLVTLQAEHSGLIAGTETREIDRPEEEAMPQAMPAFQVAEAAAADDLTVVDGIGEKLAVALNENGIYSFSQLASSDPKELSSMLDGPEYELADSSTWPQQAQLAAERDWVRLQVLQEQLSGAVDRAESGLEDELTRIEGIGPKVAKLLNGKGISTFAQLAETPNDDLNTVLAGGGAEIAMSASSTSSWKEQARLAATGRWQELLTLQEQIKTGKSGG